MRIWTLWMRYGGEVAPVEIASEAVLRFGGEEPEEAWGRITRETRLIDFPQVTEWFTRVIDVADSAILNGSTTSIAGAVVTPRAPQ